MRFNPSRPYSVGPRKISSVLVKFMFSCRYLQQVQCNYDEVDVDAAVLILRLKRTWMKFHGFIETSGNSGLAQYRTC